MPSDLLQRFKGTRATLPVGDASVPIKIMDKVFLSLRTKDPVVARARFAAAFAALVRHWEAVRAGPKPLTHKQLVALAGETYRRIAQQVEDDPCMPAAALKEIKVVDAAVAEFLAGCDESDDQDRREAAFLEAIQRPFGPQLLAIETGRDLTTPYASVTHEQALEDLFGGEANLLLAERQLIVDAATRSLFLREIGRAVVLLNEKVHRNVEGDYSEDKISRFPAFVPESPTLTPTKTGGAASGKITLVHLFETWCAKKADMTAQATVRRYKPSINSLAAFLKGRDIRLVTQDEVWAWAEHRRDKQAISPSTVNGNDLVAAASVFQFATTRDGNRLRLDNPVKGVKLDLPKKRKLRDGTFRADEISAILRLARSANDPRHCRAYASRRWAPWICAYSGARVQEVC